MSQFGLHAGGDCAAGVPGIEDTNAALSVGCFVDKDGYANLRFATQGACPAVYVGVLGTGGDIGALWSAWQATAGDVWSDPGSDLQACKAHAGGVSAPPPPTDVRFLVHTPRLSAAVTPPYRLEVTWDESVTADTTIEVYGVTRCPTPATMNGTYCIHDKTKLPKIDPGSARERSSRGRYRVLDRGSGLGGHRWGGGRGCRPRVLRHRGPRGQCRRRVSLGRRVGWERLVVPGLHLLSQPRGISRGS